MMETITQTMLYCQALLNILKNIYLSPARVTSLIFKTSFKILKILNKAFYSGVI